MMLDYFRRYSINTDYYGAWYGRKSHAGYALTPHFEARLG